MNEKTPLSPHLSDENILQTIQSFADDTSAFEAVSEWGFNRLRASVASRGDTFDRCGFVLLEDDGLEVLRIPISCLPATIGSGQAADYRLEKAGISRLHCHLEFIGNLVRIHDDKSTNGVILNRKKVDAEDLCDGDELQLGSVIFRVRKA